MPNETMSLRERKKEWTYANIARATLDLAMERGFAAVRIEDICRRADIGRSTFFRYFDSKEASFVAGVHQNRFEAVLEAVDRRPPHEDALAALRGAFLDVIEGWREVRDVLLLEAEIRDASSGVHARALAARHDWESSLALRIADRVPAGRDRELRARLLASAAVTATALATAQWLESGAARSPAPLFRNAFNVVEQMVSGR